MGRSAVFRRMRQILPPRSAIPARRGRVATVATAPHGQGSPFAVAGGIAAGASRDRHRIEDARAAGTYTPAVLAARLPVVCLLGVFLFGLAAETGLIAPPRQVCRCQAAGRVCRCAEGCRDRSASAASANADAETLPPCCAARLKGATSGKSSVSGTHAKRQTAELSVRSDCGCGHSDGPSDLSLPVRLLIAADSPAPDTASSFSLAPVAIVCGRGYRPDPPVPIAG